MRIALVNTVKPGSGSGAGMAEYTYQLYKELKKKNKVDIIYALDGVKRDDIRGLTYSFSLFREKLTKVNTKKYDIIHITNHEIGFAAKIFKKKDQSVKVVTTIHDTTRLHDDFHKGVFQKVYNTLVKSSIKDAIGYSDCLMFDSDQTMHDIKRRFSVTYKCTRISLGVKEELLKKPIKKKVSGAFTIGYLGSFAFHKNVMLIMKAAKILVRNKKYRFMIYGTGIEYKNLEKYKLKHKLTNVSLKGFASEARMVEIYDSFNAFVFPSLYEGFGLPILEAQARGLPVIVYKKGKISDEVRKYCFVAKDELEIAKIIKRIKSKGYSGKARTSALKYARSFAWSRTANEVIKIYKKISM